MKYLFCLIATCLSLAACQQSPVTTENAQAMKVNLPNDRWKDLWYDGQAEVNIYETEQARYRDIHPGQTVLIFVTEDFLTQQQVKNETNSRGPSTPVLKTNLLRKFTTGIYDYSIMTSVFTPVDHEHFPRTLKINLSSQDWCGQSFMQLNFDKNKYQVNQFSYFEKEGDELYEVKAILSEDEIFNQLRFNPEILPTGHIEMLPGLAFSRLKHIEYKPYPVTVSRTKYSGTDFSGNNLNVYTVDFPDLDRNLEIIYESGFPYSIAGWKDSYPALSGEKLTSTFKRISTERIAYWSKHDPDDSDLRRKIGL